MSDGRIVSIASAAGWWAIDPESGDVTRLSCFALTDEGRVLGLDHCLGSDAPLSFSPETCGQDEYVYLGESPSAEAIQREVERVRIEIAEDTRGQPD